MAHVINVSDVGISDMNAAAEVWDDVPILTCLGLKLGLSDTHDRNDQLRVDDTLGVGLVSS